MVAVLHFKPDLAFVMTTRGVLFLLKWYIQRIGHLSSIISDRTYVRVPLVVCVEFNSLGEHPYIVIGERWGSAPLLSIITRFVFEALSVTILLPTDLLELVKRRDQQRISGHLEF